MKFITNIDKDRYNSFVTNSVKSHFLQSYEWGEFAKLEKHLIPHYVGIENDEGSILCAALLLEKKLPLNMTYFYAPRGFVIDYNDEELLQAFVKNIKTYVKEFKAIFVKIDPDLVIKRTNYLDETVTNDSDFDKDKVLTELKKQGFKHLGFTQEFETMQPRFSFRIDFGNDLDIVIDHFSKTTKQRIKKADDLQVEVRIGSYEDIEEFYNLMRITENRKDFVTHNLSYYQTLYKLFNSNDGVNLFIGSVDISKMLDKKNSVLSSVTEEFVELNKVESRSKSQNNRLKEITREKEKLESDIIKYTKIQEEYGSKITLNGHFIIKYGDMAWVLYAGNHNILTDTYANYKTYLEHISYYHDKVKIYDQFGTVGNIDHDNHLYGLHEFKKKFGGDYVEFIGEFDLVLNKFMYIVFTKLVPIYRNIIKTIAKKKNRR